MSRRHRRRRFSEEGVRLNMAAMLDMAFQLLAFFIATFKPMTIEQQIALKLPPPEKIMSDKPANNSSNDDVTKMLKTMRIGIDATPDGELSSILFVDDQSRARDLNDLEAKMRAKLELSYKGTTPVEQVVLEIDPRLSLQHTMEVMDRCLRQQTADKKQLTKISPILAKLGGGAGK